VPGYLILPFLTGLLDSGHCIGMCGGFVLALGASGRHNRPPAVQIFYNLGRITTYGILGLLFGTVGSFGGGAFLLGPWRSVVLFFAGGVMLLLAMNILGIAGRPWENSEGFVRGPIGSLVGRLARGGTVLVFPLGMVMGLVPCGLVYTQLIAAAGTGSSFSGTATMLAFGGGTLPAMLGLGLLSSRLSPTSRLVLYRGAALVVIVMAFRFILQGLALLEIVPHTRFW